MTRTPKRTASPSKPKAKPRGLPTAEALRQQALFRPYIAKLQQPPSNKDMAQIIREAGLPKDALNNVLNRPTALGVPLFNKLANYLRIPLHERDGTDDAGHTGSGNASGKNAGAVLAGVSIGLPQPSVDADEDVTYLLRRFVMPLHRQGEPPSMDAITEDVRVGTMPAPLAVAENSKLYAVYVDDDRHAPEIRAGRIAVVDPNTVPSVGDWVRLFPIGRAAFFGELVAGGNPRVGETVVRVASEPALLHFAPGECRRIETVVSVQARRF